MPSPSPVRSRRAPRPIARVGAALAALTVGAVVAGLLSAPAGAASGRSDDQPGRGLPSAPLARQMAAKQALADVQRLIAPKPRRERRAMLESGHGRSLTMAMRDLVLRADDLPLEEQVLARSITDRPRTSQTACAGVICVHWFPIGSKDAQGREIGSTQGYAQSVLNTVTHVHNTYVAAGFRSPKTDANIPDNGGGGQVDIYLDDIHDLNYYGYCTIDPDAPKESAERFDMPAFCVLDNDYAPSQYGTRRSPEQNLQVTAAHEYFHAVQFGYDASEDPWFMEATATWAEDYVYNDINDNVQYLAESPLTHPRMPMDTSNHDVQLPYGDWIFFRFLSELYPDRAGALPSIVRSIWQHADSAGNPRDTFSINAVARELKARGTTLSKVFAQFAAANRHPWAVYDEAAANGYPVAGPEGVSSMRRRGARVGGSYKLDHLSSATRRFEPRAKGAKNKLRVRVDMAPRRTGSGAVVSIYRTNGAVQTKTVKLSKRGNGTARVPFNRKRIDHVELTLANGSAKFRCWRYTDFSCQGQPRHDNRIARYTAAVTRR